MPKPFSLVRSGVELCFDSTSSHVKLETGRLNVILFLALHSYFPLSFQTADLIMRSDLRLEKSSRLSDFVEVSFDSFFTCRSYRKWTKMYFVLFLFIDRPSLNQVTFGAGSPFTLHTIFTRLPSLTVKFGVSDSIEARLPKSTEKVLFIQIQRSILLGCVECAMESRNRQMNFQNKQ